MIIDCINYGFGSSNVPALPPEAKGYNSVYLEIETLNNDVFTIRRDFNDKNNAYWIYSKFEDINDDTSFEKIKAESKTDKNISEKILSICGCNYKNLLKKTSTGETKKFTFRDFVPLIMVNEGRITQKISPLDIFRCHLKNRWRTARGGGCRCIYLQQNVYSKRTFPNRKHCNKGALV